MTADRTTIRETLDALISGMRAALVAEPPTADKPFRRIAVGEFGASEFPRPFLAMEVARAQPIATVNGDKLMSVSVGLRVVVDIFGADAHEELLDVTSAVDDYFDAAIVAGVIEGAEGLDDRTWTFAEPQTSSGARLATATASVAFVVRVERGQNRVPAE